MGLGSGLFLPVCYPTAHGNNVHFLQILVGMGNGKVDQIFCCFCCVSLPQIKTFKERAKVRMSHSSRAGRKYRSSPAVLSINKGYLSESGTMQTARKELFRLHVLEEQGAVMSLYVYLHTGVVWDFRFKKKKHNLHRHLPTHSCRSQGPAKLARAWNSNKCGWKG